MNDSYVLPNWFDCTQPAVDEEGNCNVVWGAVQGRPADTFAELTDLSDDDDEQLSQVAKASPAQQLRPVTAIGGPG